MLIASNSRDNITFRLKLRKTKIENRNKRQTSSCAWKYNIRKNVNSGLFIVTMRRIKSSKKFNVKVLIS